MDILSVSITLFLIMDPFGNIPAFLPILEKVAPERRQRVLVRELFLALLVIMIFIFCGRYLMELLRLSQASVTIAGGIILFIIAMRMVFPTRDFQLESELDGEPLLVPLAVPLIAGPSLLAVLLVFSSTDPRGVLDLLIAALIAWVASFAVLLASTLLFRVLTKRGLIAVGRLMGMILVVMSVQLFLDGLSEYLYQ